MSNNLMDRFLYAIEQNLLAQALTIQHAHRLKDQPRFQAMFAFPALIIRNQTRDSQ